jgi:ribonucleoside-diphosphate reductase alpha chain
MELPQKILSDMVVHMKYARYDKDKKRRETWDELVDRNALMHYTFYKGENKLDPEEFMSAYESIRNKEILPSMRSLQFGGLPIERNPSRIYNCAYLPVEHPDAFSETMFLLLGGTGVGYSVQERHVEKLPKVIGPKKRNRRYKIGDSIEGWADAVKVLVESYFYNRSAITFDFSDIREKGSELVVTGGKAPGPTPLRICLEYVRSILDNSRGRKLRPIEAHDIQCYIADAVLAGGIRRAAMISLFSPTDLEMMQAKSGNWWEVAPQRSRANNSVVLLRNRTSKKMFDRIWKQVEASGSGEPGIYWTNNLDWGTNPCAEIALRPYQFCNLVEVNADGIVTEDDAIDRVRKATYIATLQAGYTDFHYLRGIWKETTKEDALIGVGVTGIASNTIKPEMLELLSNVVKNENHRVAISIGINPAARCTTVKPSGTSSLVLGTSSGVHAWHNDYFLRRMRVNKDEEIYTYLKRALPQFVEDSVMNPDGEAILTIPQKAPDGAVLRSESPFKMFKRVMDWNTGWVRGGHNRGDNANNVSATFSLKEGEWEKFGELMWDHRDDYNGISVLPYDGGTYVQAPLEDITREEYEKLAPFLRNINLEKVHEEADYTDLTGEAACAGGACEISF